MSQPVGRLTPVQQTQPVTPTVQKPPAAAAKSAAPEDTVLLSQQALAAAAKDQNPGAGSK